MVNQRRKHNVFLGYFGKIRHKHRGCKHFRYVLFCCSSSPYLLLPFIHHPSSPLLSTLGSFSLFSPPFFTFPVLFLISSPPLRWDKRRAEEEEEEEEKRRLLAVMSNRLQNQSSKSEFKLSDTLSDTSLPCSLPLFLSLNSDVLFMRNFHRDLQMYRCFATDNHAAALLFQICRFPSRHSSCFVGWDTNTKKHSDFASSEMMQFADLYVLLVSLKLKFHMWISAFTVSHKWINIVNDLLQLLLLTLSSRANSKTSFSYLFVSLLQ